MLIWDLENYQCIRTIEEVDCNSLLELANGTIIVGGCGEIIVINKDNYQIEKKIKSQEVAYLTSMIELRDENLLCGSEEGELCVYDIHLKTIKIKEMAHTKSIPSLLVINNNKFISCSDDCTIKIWDYQKVTKIIKL